MTDAWFYVQNGKQSGPISLDELRGVLSKHANVENFFVWRPGFQDWAHVNRVTELTPYLKLAPTGPPPLDRPRKETQPPEIKANKHPRSITGSIVSLIVIAAVIAGIRHFRSSHLDTATISGDSRTQFVAEGIKSCMQKQENSPKNKSLSLSKETLSKYCSCYMNALADVTNYGDLRLLAKSDLPSPEIKKKLSEAETTCSRKMMRSLLGGG